MCPLAGMHFLREQVESGEITMKENCNEEIASEHVMMVKKVTWGGMFTNILLASIKFVVGFIGSSQAVIADAVHSLSDMSTDFAVLLGVKFWSAPPDEHHPYGHQKIEEIITAAIGLALAAVAIGLGYNSLVTISEDHIQKTGWVAVSGPVLSIIAKEILYQWTVRVGHKVKSSAVIANAWHHRSDALSSIPALIAVIVAVVYPEWGIADHIGAMIIAGFILKVSWDIVVPALQRLSDIGAPVKAQHEIEDIAMEVEGVKNVHAVRTRKFGSFLYIDMHIRVDSELTVREGHNISECVKERLVSKGPDILDVVIHIEPYDKDKINETSK